MSAKSRLFKVNLIDLINQLWWSCKNCILRSCINHLNISMTLKGLLHYVTLCFGYKNVARRHIDGGRPHWTDILKGLLRHIFVEMGQRGCCIRSPLAAKLLHVVLFHDYITQPDIKKSSPFHTCDLSLHWVSAMSVHYF